VVRVLLDASRAVLPRTHRESDIFVSSSAFSHMYSTTGLVGFSAAASPAQSTQLVRGRVCVRVFSCWECARNRQSLRVCVRAYMRGCMCVRANGCACTCATIFEFL